MFSNTNQQRGLLGKSFTFGKVSNFNKDNDVNIVVPSLTQSVSLDEGTNNKRTTFRRIDTSRLSEQSEKTLESLTTPSQEYTNMLMTNKAKAKTRSHPREPLSPLHGNHRHRHRENTTSHTTTSTKAGAIIQKLNNNTSTSTTTSGRAVRTVINKEHPTNSNNNNNNNNNSKPATATYEIQFLNDRVKELMDDLKKRDSSIASLIKEKDVLKEENDSLFKLLEDSSSSSKSSSSKNKADNNNDDDQKIIQEQLEKQLQDLQQNNKSLNQHLNEMKEANEAYLEEEKELRQQIDDLMNNKSSGNSKRRCIENDEENIHNLLQQLQLLKSELAVREKTVEKREREIEQLRNDLQITRRESEQLQVEQLRRESSIIKEQQDSKTILSKKGEHEAIIKENEELKQMVDNFASELLSKESKISSLEAENMAIELELENMNIMQVKFEEAENELHLATNEKEQLNVTVDHLKAQLTEQERKLLKNDSLKVLTAERDKMERVLSKVKLENESLRHQLKDITRKEEVAAFEMKAVVEKKSSLEKLNIDFQNENDQMDQRISVLTGEAKKSTQLIEELKSEVSDLKLSIKSKSSTILKLERDIIKQQESHNTMESALNAIESERNELTAQIKELEETLQHKEKCEVMLNQLRPQHDHLQNKFKSTHTALESAQTEIDLLTSNLKEEKQAKENLERSAFGAIRGIEKLKIRLTEFKKKNEIYEHESIRFMERIESCDAVIAEYEKLNQEYGSTTADLKVENFGLQKECDSCNSLMKDMSERLTKAENQLSRAIRLPAILTKDSYKSARNKVTSLRRKFNNGANDGVMPKESRRAHNSYGGGGADSNTIGSMRRLATISKDYFEKKIKSSRFNRGGDSSIERLSINSSSTGVVSNADSSYGQQELLQPPPSSSSLSDQPNKPIYYASSYNDAAAHHETENNLTRRSFVARKLFESQTYENASMVDDDGSKISDKVSGYSREGRYQGNSSYNNNERPHHNNVVQYRESFDSSNSTITSYCNM